MIVAGRGAHERLARRPYKSFGSRKECFAWFPKTQRAAYRRPAMHRSWLDDSDRFEQRFLRLSPSQDWRYSRQEAGWRLQMQDSLTLRRLAFSALHRLL